jgi:hypothetical protein
LKNKLKKKIFKTKYKMSNYSRQLTPQQFIEKARKIHGNLYDYSLTKYRIGSMPVDIICSKHGRVTIPRAAQHIYPCGRSRKPVGCRFCADEKKANTQFQSWTLEEFLERAISLHGNKYDYSQVEFKGVHNTITIICPKHGTFTQEAYHHTRRKKPRGCSQCTETKGESAIRQFLEDNIRYITQYRIYDPDGDNYGHSCEGCPEISSLRWDFYLPDYDLFIEFDGEQHFYAVEFFGGEKGLVDTQRRDAIKNQFIADNNLNLMRIPYWKLPEIPDLLKKRLLLD